MESIWAEPVEDIYDFWYVPLHVDIRPLPRVYLLRSRAGGPFDPQHPRGIRSQRRVHRRRRLEQFAGGAPRCRVGPGRQVCRTNGAKDACA